MTRFSSSRDLLYSAPPTPEEGEAEETTEDATGVEASDAAASDD